MQIYHHVFLSLVSIFSVVSDLTPVHGFSFSVLVTTTEHRFLLTLSVFLLAVLRPSCSLSADRVFVWTTKSGSLCHSLTVCSEADLGVIWMVLSNPLKSEMQVFLPYFFL